MKRKTLALLLSAMLAAQPSSVVLAEDLLSSGNENAETVPETTEPQGAALADDVLANEGETAPDLVGGTDGVTEEKAKAGAEAYRESDTKQSTDYGIQIYHGSAYTAVTSDNAVDVLGNGTVSYDAATNTLTLNEATLTCETKNQAVISVINEGAELRLELIGQNQITADRCIDVTPDLVITGEGALEMQGGISGLYASNNLTIEGVNINANVVGTDSAIRAEGFLEIINCENITVSNESGRGIDGLGGVEITNSNVTLTAANMGLAGDGKGVTITDSTVSASSRNSVGVIVLSNEGTLRISGSTVTAETLGAGHHAIGCSYNVLEISDSKVTATAMGSGSNGIYAAGSLVISNQSQVTAAAALPALYSETGTTISNSTVTATASEGTAIYSWADFSAENGAQVTATTDAAESNGIYVKGAVSVSGKSNVTASGTYPAVCGDTGITISNSIVTATASEGTAIFSPADISAENGAQVTATTDAPNSNGINAGGAVFISGKSNVTASGTYPAVYSDTGITISDSMVNAASDNDAAIFTKEGVRIENGANVIADGYWAGIRGNKEVVIAGSRVEATSSNDTAIFAPESLIMTDSIVNAEGNADYNGIQANNTVEVSGSWISTSGGETFAGSNDYVLINGVTGNVIGNAVVPGNVTIPEGTTIKVPSGSSLTIPENVTLINNGKVNGEGEIRNYGTVNCNNHSGGTATCTTTAICDLCGAEYGSPNGHKLQKAERKEPTCTGTGNVEYWHCTVCDKTFADGRGTQELDNIGLPAKGHLWDEGVVTKAPTCTEPGIRTCTCERCKWTLQKEVAPTGHTYAGEITKATFTKDGAVSGVCEDCGASVQREVIPQVSDVELSHTEYTYNGTNRQPKVVLKDRTGKELKPEEYSVAYPKESKVPGTYELTITLKGNYYEGTLTKAYTVKKGNQVIGLSDMTKRIDSKTVTLKAEILQGNKTGKFGYQSSNPEVASVTSWGRVTFHKVGKVEITAMTRGSANYNSAQKTITLTVAPVPTAITKLQSQNPGKLNIQYRANPDADGYQIQYGTSPDMKGAKYAAVENAAIRSYTRTDVKSGETYYVRVRTYNVVDGERIYSNWSGIKSVEVK